MSLFLLVFNSSATAQTYKKHYIAPAPWQYFTVANELVVSTLSTTPISVTVKKSDGTLITTLTNVVAGSPGRYRFTGSVTSFPYFSLNTNVNAAGLIVESTAAINVNIRNVASDATDDGYIKGNASLFSFGDAAIGNKFRAGYYRNGEIYTSNNPNYSTRQHKPVYSVMAIENNTVVNINGVATTTLNAGQSYLFSANMGSLVETSGPSVMNTSAQFDAPTVSTACYDGASNPVPPITALGNEYIVVRGGGNNISEQTTIIASEPNTSVTVYNFNTAGVLQSTNTYNLIAAGSFVSFPNGVAGTTAGNGQEGLQYSSTKIVANKNVVAYSGTASGCEVDIATLAPISACGGSKKVETMKFRALNEATDLPYFAYIITQDPIAKVLLSTDNLYANKDIETITGVGIRRQMGSTGQYLIDFTNDNIGKPNVISLSSTARLTVNMVQQGAGFSMSNFLSPFPEKALKPTYTQADCASALLSADPSSVAPFQWYLNGTAITGATSNTYQAPVSGTYTVTSQLDCGISAQSLPITIALCNVDLILTKAVDNTSPSKGGTVNFTITVKNSNLASGTVTGTGNAIGVSATDLLPSGYTYVSNVAATGTSYDPATGLWSIGSMNAGQSLTLTITAKVNNSGNYNNIATVTGSQAEPVLSNNTASASVTPVDISLTSASGTDAQSICSGASTTAIQYQITGTPTILVKGLGASGLSYGTTTAGGNTILTIDAGTVSNAGDYNYTVRATYGSPSATVITTTGSIMVSPQVTTPVFALGATSSRCQGFGTQTYSATASNATGITYSISPANSGVINANSGAVTWSSVYSGTVTITATAVGICGTKTANHTVTINSTGTISGAGTVCSGSNGTLTLSGAPSTVVRWESSTDNGINWTTIANTTTTLNYTNITVTTLYRAIVSGGGCTNAASGTANVTVTPRPVIANQTYYICKTGSFAFAPIDVPNGTTYTWSSPTLSSANITGGTAGADQLSIDQTLTNSGTTLQTATYTVTPTYSSCAGNAFTITVYVVPTPNASATGTAICSASAFSIMPNSNVNGTTYTWTAALSNGTASGFSNQSTAVTAPISQTLTNTSGADATVRYTVTPIYNGCSGASFTFDVIVRTATPAPTASNQTFCEISNATIASLAATGTSVKWYTQATGGTALASTTALANGTYYASQTLNSCESVTRAQITVTITATPAPTASNQTFCEISNATVANLAATGTSVKWYTQATGGTALASTTALANGTYYASQTLNSCESATRAQITVTIYPTPKGFNDAWTLDCAGIFSYNIQTLNINNTAKGGNSVPASFTWTVNANANVTGAANGSGNTITQTLFNTSNSIQTIVYTVTPKATVTGACIGNAFTITVSVPVCSSISITKSADVSLVNKAGNIINYTVTVANTGNANQNNIIVSDPLLGGNLNNPTKIGNTDNILEKGETWTYNGSYTVLQSDLNNNGNPTNNTGKITNTASVNTTELPTVKTATADVNIVLSPAVTLVKTGTLNVNGNSISYLFTVKNTGNVTLNNLVVTDSKVTSAIILAATTLAPGMSTTATASYTISTAERATGSVSNTATVNGKDPLNGNVSDVSGTTEGSDTPTVTNTGVYAVDDEGTLSAVTGGVAVNNVLVNDKVNGNQATLVNVTISQVSSSNPNISIDPATGKVNVLPGTPVGNYTLVYQIEDKANPGNVKEATVTIHLVTGVILAVNDSGSANSFTGGTAITNVLGNDTYNGGAQANLSNVTITNGTNDSNGKVTLDPATGAVNVAANTPAGIYTLTYTITDKLDASKTSTATVKVTVVSGALLAKDDAGTSNSVSGGTAVANVLANDTYNGTSTAPTLSDVTITNGTNDSNGKVTLDPATGAVSVAANTPAGVYTLTYTITDKLDASKTSTATVKVTVASGTLLAKDDAGTSNSVTGGTAITNVLSNDTYNGMATAPTLSDVTITNGTDDSNSKVSLDPTTGAVSVAANTPAGVYTLTYTITDKLDASKTSTATVKVTVASGALLAKDDAGTSNSVTGGTAITNVLSNDTYNGMATAPTLADVTITNGTNDSNGKVSLDPTTGAVSVATNTPAGVYTLTYTITDKLDASKTSIATVKVTVASGALLAKDDAGTSNSVSGGTAVANVLANDNYNGTSTAPTLNDVTITNGTNDSNGKVTLDPTTGAVSVAANTPAGVYTLTYTITDKLDASKTSTATVKVTVASGVLLAKDDAGTANSVTGGNAVANVLANDTYNGTTTAPTLNDVIITNGTNDSNGKVTLDPTTGAVSVAANTPAGVYTLTYIITDKLDASKTSTATVKVTVSSGALLAKDDAGTSNSVTGGTAVANVLTNDTYNGTSTAPTLSDVTITKGTNDSNGKVTLDPLTRAVSVAANTPAGVYTLTYTITDKLDASKTSTAMVKVTVASGVLLAKDDAGTANSITGGTTVENVLANDTYNGTSTAPTLNDVTITNGTNDSNGKVALDPTTGVVSVAANTPSGVYTLTYTITDKLDASKTSTATVKVTVSSGTLLAKDDAGATNSLTGGTAVANVLANDTYNGTSTAPTLNDVTITNGTNDSNGKVILDPTTGAVSVAANTLAGVYTLTYTITDKLDASKTSTATIKVTVASGVLLAKDDAGTANSVTGGTAVANVLANDTYNGTSTAPTLNDVTIINGTNNSNGKVILDPSTGVVSVAANTPSGVYTLTYTITDKLDASKTSTAMVKVTVASGVLLAKDDAGTSNSVTGGTAVASVLVNDTYNGTNVAPTLADVTITNGTNDSNGKVSLDPTTGAVSVATNTPAGVYTLTYTITDKLDATKTSTATVKVTVTSGALLAKDDAGTANSVTGGTAVANVLANDTYNGTSTSPTLNDVSLSQVSTTNSNVTLNVATGQVDVKPNTAAGVYTLVYQIVDKLDASQSKQATVTITVAAPIFAATNDSGNANGFAGGTAVENVLANDTYNGNPATLNDVKLSQVSTTNPNVALDVTTGKVNVAPNTPAGTYTLVYQIEDKLNPGQTKTATVTITVGAPVLAATNDSGNANGFTGGTAVENVLANDTYNGNPVTLNDVKLSQVSTANPNVTLDVTTGKVNVAPNTPAGNYILVYQIEDKLNPGQTKTATVTITVGAPALTATNDSGNANGFTGGTAVENVLANDTYNGNPTTLNDVKLSQVSTSNPNVTLDVTTGKVNVAPNTPAGTYTLVYQIEDKLNTGQAKTATITITVAAPALAAVNDSGNANGFTGGTAVENVLANDTYNGNPATLNDVKLSQVSTSNPNVTLDVTTGKVNVAPNTPAGNYILVYQIEDKLNPGQTKTATVTITVGAPALTATNDSGNANGFTGGTAVENVLANDTYNGNPTTLNDVKLSQVSTSNPNVTLDVTTGKVNVAPNTPAGTYTLVYQIEDKLNTGQAKTATITITVAAPALAAVNDSGNANGFTGGTAVENVLANDTYNGNPATLNDVKLSQVSTTNPNVALDVTTGKVNVAPNTPAGNYILVYQIEDKLNPGQTKTATVTITVGAPTLAATNDSGDANGYTGGTAVENVLTNDTYNGNPVTLNVVKLSQVSTANPNVTLDVTTGKVNVAPNTTAGTYTLVYQIEDKLNTGQTKTATITITVGAPTLAATNDSGDANGYTGGTAVENVLANDTYNGNPATLNDVKLSQVSTTNPNVALDVTTGKVNVAPNTPAGNYILVYQIEDKLNPGQTKTATVTFTVGAPTLAATNDSGDANGYTGGTAVENVLANDTYNGNPATLNDVKLSQVSTTNPNVTLDVTTGKVNVAPNTPAGTYTLVYQIEDKLNPGQTKTATVTITVGAPVLTATNDSGDANGYAGGTAVENVLANDTYNGNPATLNDVKLSQVSTTNPNVSLDVTTGKVNVAPNTPAGTYTLVYQIEDKLNPGQAKTATVTITVGTSTILAKDDAGSANGFTGGIAVENILVNDKYNDVSAATTATVVINQISTSNPKINIDPATGKVNVTAGTLPGVYTLIYQISDKLDAGKTSTAVITVSIPNWITDLQINKTANVTAVETNGDISYTITIKNNGPATVLSGESIGLIENLPAGLENVSYNAIGGTYSSTGKTFTLTADLLAGQQVSLTVNGRVAAAFSGTDLVNSVSLSSTAKSTDPENINNQSTVTTPIMKGKVALVKTGTLSADGNSITYTFNITNIGDVILNNVVLIDQKLALNKTFSTALAVGASFTYNQVYTLSQSDKDAGSVSNTASVSAKTPAGNTITDISGTASGNDNPTETPISNTSSLTFTKVASAVGMKIGESIDYNFTITNTGSVTLSNLILSDAAVDVGSIKPASIATLAPGASVNVTAKHTLTQIDINQGSFTNQASIKLTDNKGNVINQLSDDPSTPAPNDATVTKLTPSPGFTLTKSATNSATKAGDVINYNIIFKNTGNVTLTDITLVDANADAGSLTPSNITSVLPGATINITAKHTVKQSDVNAGGFSNQVSANVKDPKGNAIVKVSDDPSTPAADDATFTTIVANPSVRFTKTFANSAGVVKVIEYSIQVTNTGNVTLTDIVVTDEGADLGSITPAAISKLEPAETALILARHTLTQPEIDNGKFINQASLVAKYSGANKLSKLSDDPRTLAPDDPTVFPIKETPGLTLVKTGVLSADGNSVTYTFTAKNTGNVTLSNFSLLDPKLSSTITFTPASIAPDQTAVATAVYTITQAEKNASSVRNSATLAATTPAGTSVSDVSGTEEDNDYPTILELPKIVSSKTVTDANNNGKAEANEVLTYHIIVKNNGNAARMGVKITDAIPVNTTYISASADNGGSLVGNVLNWNNLTIPANGQVQVSFKVTVNAIIPSGVLSVNNTATVTDPGNTSTPLSPAVSIPTDGMLEGSKSVVDSKGNKDGKAQANEILTYSLQIKNTGGSALNGVTITDELPAGLTYIPNSVSGYGTVMGNTLKWTINMQANSSTVLTFDAKVAPDVNSYNTIKNVAIMTAPTGITIKPEALMAVDKSADLMVTKELVTKGDIKTGSDVTYKITVTNKGPNRATGVTVTDKLSTIIDAPKEITVTIGATTYTTTSRDLVWLVGSLDLNQSATLTFKARTLAAGVLNNSATVKADQPDPILNNNMVQADAATITGDDLLIPNLFTPNGDGINDTFEINGLAEFAENEITIVNRWGNEVFRAKGYQNNWTGEGLNEGTYYYLLRARKGGNNEWKVFKGYITLIRAFKN
ncbi:PKD-like domain-containing protein [Pedobacter sp. W3I1]|uniref:DUF7507 domain-containing protein n=1 Tax=Pedobacter sp. W3I1 TaxID=3042291 RepID=UPI0027D7C1B7|nr:PKD-like domain-containing protein [Pedobacter sp. W3I1]